MDLTVDKRTAADGVSVLTLEGEIDVYTSIKLKEDITDILRANPKHLIMDLSKVEYLDSSGLGVLIGTLKKMKESEGSLIIVGPPTRIMRIFEITGLYKIFSIYATEEEARDKEGITL